MSDEATHPAVQAVQAYLAARQQGGAEAARAYWADDAIWHITGKHEFAGDYRPDAYLEFLSRWVEDHPAYTARLCDMTGFGDELAVFFVESTGGPAPSAAPGLAVFRVVAGKITEGWAIPAFAGGHHPF